MNDRPCIEGSTLRLRTHSVHIENRELASITGVKDVGSFNESMVVLMTEGGGLDEGQVIIEGQIIAFEYDDVPVQRGSVFSRMFR